MWMSMYEPGRVPLHTVAELAFIGPGPIEQQAEWLYAISEHPALKKEMDDLNAVKLFPAPLAAYQIMSKTPIIKVDDLMGKRLRATPTHGAPLEKFGAVIEMLPAPDIYTAVDRGMLDGVVWIWTYTFGSYKLYELLENATIDMDIGLVHAWYSANKDAWNALPEDWRKLHNWWAAGAAQRFANEMARADVKWLPIYADAGVKIHRFPPEEKAKLVVTASDGWADWVKRMEDQGLPGQEVLDFVIAKREEVVAKAQ